MQHVDDLADLLVAPDDGVHLLGLGGEIDAEFVERRCPRRPVRRIRARRPDGRAIHGLQRFLVAFGPNGIVFCGQRIGVQFLELTREVLQRAVQLEILQHAHQDMARADLHLAKEQRRVEPAALQRVDDLLRDLGHLGDPGLEAIDHRLHVTHQLAPVEPIMITGQRQIRAIVLQDMGEPMSQFEVGISCALGLTQRLNEAVIPQAVQLPSHRLETDIGH